MSTTRRPNYWDDTAREFVQFTDNDCIPQTAIRDGDVSTAKIADNAVTTDKIGPGAVTSNEIANGTITTNDIQIRAINQGLLANDAVGRNQLDLASGAVTTSGRAIVLTSTNELTTTEIGGSGTNPRAPGDGLVLDGNELDLDPVVRNQILLINGFLVLTRGSTTGTRTAYTGIIAGYPSATYYFDTSDSSWYDAVTAGNRLIGF